MNTHRILVAGLAGLFFAGQCRAVIPDQMVGYWPFNETSGSVAHDASGVGFNGSLVNYVSGQDSWGPGMLGGSLHFGGLSAQQYVEVPDFLKPTSALTVSAWIWADSLPQWATIAANWNGSGTLHYEMFGSNPYLADYFADSAIDTVAAHENSLFTPELSLGAWHHVAVVVNGATRRVQFWRDGQNAGFTTFQSGTFYPATRPQLEIGGTPFANPGQGYWDGRIDDVGVWDRALSQSEIQTIYTNGLAGIPLMAVPEPHILSIISVGLMSSIFIMWRRKNGAPFKRNGVNPIL